MVGLNVRKWGFYDKTVKNFKPFCWWDAFRSVWMTQQNAPSVIKFLVHDYVKKEEICNNDFYIYLISLTSRDQ
jgi:hypothetical protein